MDNLGVTSSSEILVNQAQDCGDEGQIEPTLPELLVSIFDILLNDNIPTIIPTGRLCQSR